MNFMTFHSVGNNYLNWRTHIFQRGRSTTDQNWDNDHPSYFWSFLIGSNGNVHRQWQRRIFPCISSQLNIELARAVQPIKKVNILDLPKMGNFPMGNSLLGESLVFFWFLKQIQVTYHYWAIQNDTFSKSPWANRLTQMVIHVCYIW